MTANIVLFMLLAWLVITFVMALLAGRSPQTTTLTSEQEAGRAPLKRRITHAPIREAAAQSDGMLATQATQPETSEAAPAL
ncbi:MAG TPA: hypothetical protein VKQ36_12915 [Ktedonobacterales bacterium]|nr:hypothetical protein [Ktedonobacterales bacterium]